MINDSGFHIGPTVHRMARSRSAVALLALAGLLAGCIDYGPSSPTPSGSSPTVAPSPTASAPTSSPTAAPTAPLAGVIVFQSNRDPNRPLSLVAPDGSNLRPAPISQPAGAPALSPDGTTLAFTSKRLFVAGLDGSNLRAFPVGAGRSADALAWSPDGHRIAFVDHGAEPHDIRLAVLELATGKVTELPALVSGDRPGWSQDGHLIVYGNADNGGLATYGLEQHVVTRLTSSDDSFASFSPDGRLLAFERADPTTGDTQVHRIVVAFADGANPQVVTTGPLDDEYPAWSPDGSWIVFARLDGQGGGALWRVAVTGGDAVRITPDGALDSWPSWGPCASEC